MATTLHLIRHGATEANLRQPYQLQGVRSNPPLAAAGVWQAERTREALALEPVTAVYCSPLKRALETARILAAPRDLSIFPVDALRECDVGRWEGLTWDAIRAQDAEAYQRFLQDPGRHGYPAGETFNQVAERACPFLDQLLETNPDANLVVVSHHVVNRVYLAGVMGLSPSQAREVKLDNCGISTIVREAGRTTLLRVNATAHLEADSAAA